MKAYETNRRAQPKRNGSLRPRVCALVTQQVGAAHTVDCLSPTKKKKKTAFGAEMRLSLQTL